MTPQNIGSHATFLDSSIDIQDRVIHFGPGMAKEKLLEVPLGVVDPQVTIVITIGLDKSHPNAASVDSDPRIGISDGTNDNVFIIVDVNNYPQFGPCYPTGGNHDATRVSSGTPVSSMFKLTFTPFNKFGFCETAQDGGYINTATFDLQLDITMPLSLTLMRSDLLEEYYFHYLKLEIY